MRIEDATTNRRFQKMSYSTVIVRTKINYNICSNIIKLCQVNRRKKQNSKPNHNYANS